LASVVCKILNLTLGIMVGDSEKNNLILHL